MEKNSGSGAESQLVAGCGADGSICGTPVRKEENKSGEKQPGYKDDIESTMGRFDGKYMLIAGVILGVCIIFAGIRKLTYTPPASGETAAAATVETVAEDTEALETTNE